MPERAAYRPVAEHLPAVYRDDERSFAEVRGYLGLVDAGLRSGLLELDELTTWLSIDAREVAIPGLAPEAGAAESYRRLRALFDELASWFAYEFPPSWTDEDDPEAELDRKREFVARAARLWRRRGTPRGFHRWLSLYFDLAPAEQPLLIEHFMYRPAGDTSGLNPTDEDPFAHRLSLLMPLTAAFSEYRRRREASEFVTRNAPAHLMTRLCWIHPDDSRFKGFEPQDQDAVRALLSTVANYTPEPDGIHLEKPPAPTRPLDRLGHGTLPGPARKP